jgi:hypothetical protein
MVDRWTISVPDDTARRVMERLNYGDNRSEWIVDAIEQKLNAETDGQDDTETRAVERHEDTHTRDEVGDRIDEVVDDVSASWDDTPERLKARRDAARAALRLAVSRGALTKSEAVEDVLPNHEVDGQSNETWWRKNVRPVLQEVGEHAPGRGYVVDLDDEE